MAECPYCKKTMALNKDYYYCDKCNKSWRKCEVYSRCVGYLRPVDQWNRGKKREFEDRKVFKPWEL
jgi:ribonucleoside-triphosphate reductase